jgi:peptidoglycan/LPS O-acetylase OafA/YrhL
MHNTSTHLTHPKYRPDIDGLRAIAIISVVLFHAFRDIFKGGFIGVDIFFVISGFLISTILFSSIEENRYSILEFYVKRIRRIFPALITVMVATIFIAWYVLFSDELERFGRHMTSGITFVSNFVFWRESGYFDDVSETKPLLHFWSLAIEEQFYLFWPILLAFFWKKGFGYLKLIIIIAFVSFTLNILILKNHPVASFFLPITRVWELILGGLLAHISLYQKEIINRHHNAQSILGFLLLLIGFAIIHEGNEFPGWWALLPTFGAFFVISAGPNAWLNKKILSNKVMIWVGNISYPIYLWHWPLLSFAFIIGNGNISNIQLFCILVLTVLLSWLTYIFIEKPIRFGRYKSQAIPAMLLCMVALLGVSLLIQFGIITPRNNSADLRISLEARNDHINYNDDRFTLVEFDQERFYYTSNKSQNYTAIIGDSHALQYIPRLTYLLSNHSENFNNLYLAIHEGCLPVPGMPHDNTGINERRACNNYRNSIIELLKDPKIKTIILAACWNCYLVKHEEKSNQFMEANGFAQEPLKSQILESLKTFLKNESINKTVYLLLDNPMGKDYEPSNYAQGNRLSGFTAGNMKAENKMTDNQLALRAELLKVAKQAKVKIIDPVDYLCKDGHCRSLDKDGKPIYKDNNHLRASYAMDNATFIDQAILQYTP